MKKFKYQKFLFYFNLLKILIEYLICSNFLVQNKISIKLKIKNYNHPIQIDSVNCGIYALIFIEEILTKNTICFDNNKNFLLNFRIKLINVFESNSGNF